jgi:site-specific recombinase XerC
MQLMACLSRWMVEEEVPVAELTWERAQQFVEWRCAMGYRHFRSPRGLVPLLAYLRSLGVAPLPVTPSADGPVDLLVERYQVYLLGERGLAGGTVLYYERVARLFLEQLAAAGGELDLGRLSAGDVGRFVLEQCAARSVGSAKNVVMALRSLLRFLHVDGVTAGDLAGAVPAVAPQRRSLPRALDPRLVARLLASCDRRTKVGRRDFAVLIVLARLGLRAGEVAAIELQDIDWRRGELLVRGKGGSAGAVAAAGRRWPGARRLRAARASAGRLRAAVSAGQRADRGTVARRGEQDRARRLSPLRSAARRRAPVAAHRCDRDAACRRLRLRRSASFCASRARSRPRSTRESTEIVSASSRGRGREVSHELPASGLR